MATMSYTALELEREDSVIWCTLNRPEALNALNPTLVDELHAFYDELKEDPSVRVVVLRGAGKAFCAGLDLKQAGPVGDGSVSSSLRGQHHIAELSLKMRRLPQVFVACVHGPACGGGFMLALASDLRIAGESARMNAAFIKLGLSGCDVGVSYLLPRLIGASVAAELILTGRFIDAERARELGLVGAVVPDEALEDEARGLVADLMRTSPLGLRLSKEALNASLDMNSMDAVVSMEDRNQVLCARTRDFQEGVRSFLEKREPKFEDA
ncbi:MAG: enoyl-CoA hydratase/isomerase family protein [bacterium]|nr:enoyl-CoA hydratase/isomerase family protein [bacterium]